MLANPGTTTAQSVSTYRFHATGDVALPNVSILSFQGPQGRGSLTAPLLPMVKRLNTRVNWYAVKDIPLNDFSPRAQSVSAGFTYHQPQVHPETAAGHERFCLEYLEPLLHGLTPSAYTPALYKSYKQLNAVVASHCLNRNGQSFPSLLWLHDYHLALSAPLLSCEAGILISQFWHAPWPVKDIMLASPIACDLVSALLHNRLLGMHTRAYALNFCDTVQALYPDARVDRENLRVELNGRTTKIVVMPLGIDVDYWQKLASTARPQASALPLAHSLASQIVLSIDRFEPSKGILERLAGVRHALATVPELLKRVHFVQIAGAASDPAYRERVIDCVSEINSTFGVDNWQPVRLIEESLSQNELAAWYQAATVFSVNSLADGLNVMAKEFVASRMDEQGCLVLSQKAGVAGELSRGALMVDPADAVKLGEALTLALKLPAQEKQRRMLLMRHVLGYNQLDEWALTFLKETLRN